MEAATEKTSLLLSLEELYGGERNRPLLSRRIVGIAARNIGFERALDEKCFTLAKKIGTAQEPPQARKNSPNEFLRIPHPGNLDELRDDTRRSLLFFLADGDIKADVEAKLRGASSTHHIPVIEVNVETTIEALEGVLLEATLERIENEKTLRAKNLAEFYKTFIGELETLELSAAELPRLDAEEEDGALEEYNETIGETTKVIRTLLERLKRLQSNLAQETQPLLRMGTREDSYGDLAGNMLCAIISNLDTCMRCLSTNEAAGRAVEKMRRYFNTMKEIGDTIIHADNGRFSWYGLQKALAAYKSEQ